MSIPLKRVSTDEVPTAKNLRSSIEVRQATSLSEEELQTRVWPNHTLIVDLNDSTNSSESSHLRDLTSEVPQITTFKRFRATGLVRSERKLSHSRHPSAESPAYRFGTYATEQVTSAWRGLSLLKMRPRTTLSQQPSQTSFQNPEGHNSQTASLNQHSTATTTNNQASLHPQVQQTVPSHTTETLPSRISHSQPPGEDENRPQRGHRNSYPFRVPKKG
jgi:hypothetical protein